MKKITMYLLLIFVFVLSGCNTGKGYSPSLEEALTKFVDSEEVSLLYKNQKDQIVVFEHDNSLIMAFYNTEEGKYKFEEGNGDTAFYMNRADPFHYISFTHPETNQRYFYGIVRKPENSEKLTLTYNYDYKNEQVNEQKEADINEQNIFVIPLNRELTEIKNISFKLYDSNGEMIKEIDRR